MIALYIRPLAERLEARRDLLTELAKWSKHCADLAETEERAERLAHELRCLLDHRDRVLDAAEERARRIGIAWDAFARAHEPATPFREGEKDEAA